MTIGERIKAAREMRGYTQEDLAKKMGYSGKTSISKIETAGNNLTANTVTKYAKALDVKESYLMGWSSIDWDPKSQTIEDDRDEDLDLLIYRMEQNAEFKEKVLDYAEFLWDRMK